MFIVGNPHNKVLNDPFNAIHPSNFRQELNHTIICGMFIGLPLLRLHDAWEMVQQYMRGKNAFLVGREDWRRLLKLVDIREEYVAFELRYKCNIIELII